MKILVLAGGYDQIELIKKLKQYKHEVILADYFENPPAKKIADKHCQVSTLDVDAIEKLALDETVDLITTACTDQALLTVAKVSEKCGLPTYISYEKALKVTNKKYMKERLDELGVPTAKSRTFSNLEEVQISIIGIKYPAVVKPCDCNSSKGVVKVSNDDELYIAAQNALAMSRSNLIIVEDYILGQEVSIDIWIDNCGAKVLSISETEKIGLYEECFTIYKSKYPVLLSPKVEEKIKKIANIIAEGFELRNCPMLIQAIVKDEDVYVIEFSARMGGGTKYRLIEHMSSNDIMQIYVDRILGNENQIITPVKSEKKIELVYVYSQNGVFDRLEGFEECRLKGDIIEYYQYKETGSKITQAKTSSDRVAGFLLIADSREELETKRSCVLSKIRVLDKDGADIMLRTIYGGIK